MPNSKWMLMKNGRVENVSRLEEMFVSDQVVRELTEQESPSFKVNILPNDNLNLENFFNPAKEKCPLSVKLFCDWIDEYKISAAWADVIGEKIKFHHLPYEMQVGILIAFFEEQGIKVRTPMFLSFGDKKTQLSFWRRSFQKVEIAERNKTAQPVKPDMPEKPKLELTEKEFNALPLYHLFQEPTFEEIGAGKIFRVQILPIEGMSAFRVYEYVFTPGEDDPALTEHMFTIKAEPVVDHIGVDKPMDYIVIELEQDLEHIPAGSNFYCGCCGDTIGTGKEPLKFPCTSKDFLNNLEKRSATNSIFGLRHEKCGHTLFSFSMGWAFVQLSTWKAWKKENAEKNTAQAN